MMVWLACIQKFEDILCGNDELCHTFQLIQVLMSECGSKKIDIRKFKALESLFFKKKLVV